MTTLPARGLVLLDFGAARCAPCHQLARVLAAVERSYAGKLAVIAIDVGDEPELARRFDVRATPTVVVWRDGAEVGRIVGARPERFVAGVVERALAGDVAIASP